MTKLRILPLVAVVFGGVAGAACDRSADRAGDTLAADTLGEVETAERTAELLSPIRASGIVLIEHAQLAGPRASREEVRQFAQIIATDHRALVATLDSAARARGATLQETPAARELAHTARMAHAGLDTMTPAEFDLAFIRAQVETHRQLLDEIDHELGPAATSADMRRLLEEIRATADAHLMRARQLLGELLGEPVEPPPAGATQTAPRPLGTPPPPAQEPPAQEPPAQEPAQEPPPQPPPGGR
jgi:putative membrane protein